MSCGSSAPEGRRARVERDEIADWLRLLLSQGIGEQRARVLVQRFGSPQAALSASRQEVEGIPGMGPKTAQGLVKGVDGKAVQAQLDLIERFHVSVISFKDERYPRVLLETQEPPPLLFVRGTLMPEDGLAVAVIGSRGPTAYGKQVAERFGEGLAKKGVTVVSGMARGIDACAHRGALRAGGRTIAVLGCGVDRVYPPEHKKLMDEIILHGAVISEFVMGAEPEAGHFPTRNRIIAGLSRGVVVVEAREDSGVFSTVNWAAEQGKDVFAVPGPVTSPVSRGPNRLIKQGAALVESVEEVLEALKMAPEPEGKAPSRLEPRIALTEPEKRLVGLLTDAPLHVDTISEKSTIPVQEVLGLLLGLEIKGIVKQQAGKVFAIA
jgi:DNA processing protein